ncbi:MAG: macro domain-containing protein [Porticoccaceae bacterium]
MKITFHEGDLLASKESTIAHGCNTVGAMAAGIAGQIAAKYPNVRSAYGEACSTHNFYLGCAQPVQAFEGTRRVGDAPARLVYNLATQLIPGPDARVNAITLAFANMAAHALNNDIDRVAIPRIGCGIGGLKWDDDVLPAIRTGLRLGGYYLEIGVYDFVPTGQRPIRRAPVDKGYGMAQLNFGAVSL